MLTFVVAVGCGGEEATQEDGQAPVIRRLEVSPISLEPGAVATTAADAVDPDGDALTYRWEATAGSFADASSPATTWQAPETAGTVTLTLHALDATHDTALQIDVLVLLPPGEDPDGDGATADDCAPDDPDTHPGAIELADNVDNDCDGAIDEGTEAVDDDQDGFTEWDGDCDDADPDRYPGADDPPDGIDTDCDGIPDEGSPAADDDGDGFPEDPEGPSSPDCDDARPDIYPGALEQPDAADNDCDGSIDEDTVLSDDDGDGFSEQAGDCDDAASAVSPAVPEAPNGRDDDCDGAVDEGTVYADDDGDGYVEQPGPATPDAPEEADCDDAAPEVHPGAPELVNGRDDDCDDAVDEGTEAADDDGDGWTEIEGDCNDASPQISPDRLEAGDGIDNDCDGLIDEETTRSDDDGDGRSEEQGDCDDSSRYVRPDLPEFADGLDNDCDGSIDEATALSDDDGDGLPEVRGDCDDGDDGIFPGAIDPADDGVDQDCLETAVVQPPEPYAEALGATDGCGPRSFSAAGSVDPQGLPLRFAWFVVYAPTGSKGFDATGVDPTFTLTPDLDGVYQLGMVASSDAMSGPAVFVSFEASGCVP